MSKVAVMATLDFEDVDYEKLMSDMWDFTYRKWISIESDDDLPDDEDYYLVTCKNKLGDKIEKIAWFTLQNPAVCPSPKGFWSNETGEWKNIAWTLLPPIYEEEDENDG